MTSNSPYAVDSASPGDTAQEAPGTAPGAPQASSEAPRMSRLAWQLSMLCLGLVVGALGGQVVYHARDIVPPPDGLQGMPPYPPEVVAAAERVDLTNAAIGFGLAGGLVGAVLGGGLLLLRGAARPALTGALTGLIAGTLLGALGGVLNMLVSRQMLNVEFDTLLQAMLVHAPLWICLSLAVGLALGVPLRDVSTIKVIGATFAAAIIAALLYPFLSLLIFPAAHSELVVPFNFGNRLLWFGFGTGLLAFAAARSASERNRGERARAPA